MRFFLTEFSKQIVRLLLGGMGKGSMIVKYAVSGGTLPQRPARPSEAEMERWGMGGGRALLQT